MENLNLVEEAAIKLRTGRILVIFKLKTTEEIADIIVNDINRILVSDSFASKILDPEKPGLWWIRHTVDNKKIADEAAKSIRVIINSVKGKGV